MRVYEAGHAARPRLEESKASAGIIPPVCRMIGSRHLCGTEPRDFHWWNVLVGTPNASAVFLTSSQSSDAVVMATTHTDDLSVAQGQFARGPEEIHHLQFVTMEEEKSTRTFNEAVRALIRAWRMSQFRAGSNQCWTHVEMAEYLSILVANYTGYETRAKGGFPTLIIARFCERAGIDANELMNPARPRLVTKDGTPLSIPAAPPPARRKLKRRAKPKQGVNKIISRN